MVFNGLLERVGLDKVGRTVWFAIWTVVLAGLIFGYSTAISGSALTSFGVEFYADAAAGAISEEETKKALESMKQTMTSSITLGAFFGCFLAGACADRFGRRFSILWGTIIFGIGANVFLAFAPTFWCLVVARFLLGFEVGIVSTTAPLYLSECSPPEQRGALGALFQTFICIGIFFTSFLGFVTAEHAWRWMFGLGLIFILPLAVIAYFMPESPRWLVANGRESEARPLLEDVVGLANIELEIENIRANSHVKNASLLDVFSPLYRKHLIIGLTLCVAQQWTGINAIIYYFAPILNSTGIKGDAATGASVALFFWNFLTSTIALKYTDSLGRRTLILTGLVLQAGSLFAVGLSFVIFSGVARAVMVILGISVFIAGFEVGVGPLFFVVINEIYPEHLRASVGGLITGACWLMNFALALSFLTLNRALGSTDTDPKGWVFFIFGGVALLSIAVLMFLLVETKGKTLNEIQVLLGGMAPVDGETFDQENSVVELSKREQAERRKNAAIAVESAPAAPFEDSKQGSRRSKQRFEETNASDSA